MNTVTSCSPPPCLLLILPTWVRDHHQDAVGAVLDNVGDDKFEDVDVALHQIETALALLLPGTSSHDHHFGVGCHTVIWQSDKNNILNQPVSATIIQ